VAKARPTAARISALAEIDRVFALATIDFPQSSPGALRIGAAAMRLIERRQLTGNRFSRREIAKEPRRLQRVIGLTVGVHGLFATPENSNPGSGPNLRQALPFAYALVLSSLRAGMRGLEGEEAASLELPTGEDHRAFTRSTRRPSQVAAYRAVLSRAANVAHAVGGEAEEAAADFRERLLVNNDHFVAGVIGNEEHAERKAALQMEVGDAICRLAVADITATPIAGVDTDRAILAVRNVLVTMPSPSIPAHYFGAM
jgi:hypothetical protein